MSKRAGHCDKRRLGIQNIKQAWQHMPTKIREADQAGRAIKQSLAKFVFELCNAVRKRGLCNAALFGRPDKGFSLGQCADIAKLLKIHRVASLFY
jgi:hypothetical protein